MIAFSSSGARPGFSSTIIPRSRKIAAARGSILSAMRTLTGSATGRLPSPIEPRPERLNVGGVDRRPAPDGQARRSLAIPANVICGILGLEQAGDCLLPGLVRFDVDAVGELQADRRVRPDPRARRAMLD